MKKIPVKYLNFNPDSPDKGYWDMHMLSTIFEDKEFKIVEELTDYGIVVIPARHNCEYVKDLNEYIAKLKGVVVLLVGDEESSFPVEKIFHTHMKIWLMTPQVGRKYGNVDRFIGSGYTPQCESLPDDPPERVRNWFFSGQITHDRRRKCVKRLRKMEGGELIETKGFTLGIPPEEYIKRISESKVIPCPSGPFSPDSFRFYEALECGAIPVADAYSTSNSNLGYWELIFGENLPFPVVKSWALIEGLVNFFKDTFMRDSNKIFAWWQMYKREIKMNLIEDFKIVSGKHIGILEDGITVILPTSPVSSNPDTSIIEETLASIRAHLPHSEIILTFDGIRPEQEELREQYEEYKRILLWKCNRVWKNIVPIVFEEHMHQVAMCRESLKYVKTNKILYVEHDAPLVPDLPIDWKGISNVIDSGLANVVRFHFEATIPEEHKSMMLDSEPQDVDGVPLIRTSQWSQRPHLANTEFYRNMLDVYFTENARTFIEDKMHGVVSNAYKRQQVQGWNEFKLWIYAPEGTYKRSAHLDARGKDPKFDDKLIF